MKNYTRFKSASAVSLSKDVKTGDITLLKKIFDDLGENTGTSQSSCTIKSVQSQIKSLQKEYSIAQAHIQALNDGIESLNDLLTDIGLLDD